MSVIEDRIEFAHSISYPEGSDEYLPGIVIFFDEIMWLYGVAGNLDTTSISVNNVNQSACFNIQFMSPYQMEKFESVLNQCHYMANIYGRNFSIKSDKATDTSVNVSVQQCA